MAEHKRLIPISLKMKHPFGYCSMRSAAMAAAKTKKSLIQNSKNQFGEVENDSRRNERSRFVSALAVNGHDRSSPPVRFWRKKKSLKTTPKTYAFRRQSWTKKNSQSNCKTNVIRIKSLAVAWVFFISFVPRLTTRRMRDGGIKNVQYLRKRDINNMSGWPYLWV